MMSVVGCPWPPQHSLFVYWIISLINTVTCLNILKILQHILEENLTSI